jgi:hypothetical protein
MVIHKFPIEYGTNRISAKQSCKVLSAGLDASGQLCVWVLFNPDNERYDFTVVAVFTSETFYPTADSFIGTVLQGELVYHIFKP